MQKSNLKSKYATAAAKKRGGVKGQAKDLKKIFINSYPTGDWYLECTKNTQNSIPKKTPNNLV